MNTLLIIIISTLIVSLISFVGVITLALKEQRLRKIILVLVALSAGALIGGAFLHLIPESMMFYRSDTVFLLVLVGFGIFYTIEHLLKWRHCHEENCKVHTFAQISLFGDAIHNFMDGLVLAAAFIASTSLGISTTLAIIIHEIPQEFGDFGVLIHGGYKKSRAIFLNFVTGLTSIAGGILGYFFSTSTAISSSFLLPVAAGGFIYVAASDLIPEIRKETKIGKSTLYLIVFILGIAMMYLLRAFVKV